MFGNPRGARERGEGCELGPGWFVAGDMQSRQECLDMGRYGWQIAVVSCCFIVIHRVFIPDTILGVKHAALHSDKMTCIFNCLYCKICSQINI